MGYALSFRIAYEAARVAVPGFADAVRGRLTHADVDARVAAFARRVIAEAAIDLRVTGADRADPARSFVYMSNHQSHMDIPALYAAFPGRTIRAVAKTELFRIPVFGQAMRAAGYVEVNRGDRAQAIASLDRAAAQIRDGFSIWIAPEGSRSKTGALGPLKKGGFHLALAAQVPILPFAISGTHAVLPPGSIDMRRGRLVRVTVGEEIPTTGRDVPSLVDEVGAFLRATVDTGLTRT